MKDLFEWASRIKCRFTSSVGELTVEQLWDLPLTTKSDKSVSLNAVAINVNRQLRESGEESFISTTPNTFTAVLEKKLEIVKHIIKTKQDEAEAVRAATSRAEKRRKLLSAMERREDERLNSMTKEEILKELEGLDG
jgi:hypothetical protein